MATRPEWLVTTRTTPEMGDGAAAFRRIWNAVRRKPDGLYVQDDILYRDLAPYLLLQRVEVPGRLQIVSHVNPRDTRPLVPCPVGIGPDPVEMGEVIAANLCARMADPKAPAVGLPVPVRFYEPSNAFQWDSESEGTRT